MAKILRPTQNAIHKFDFALQNAGHLLYELFVNDQRVESIERDFEINDIVLSHLSSRPLNALETDLRDVSLQLHFADRMALRHSSQRRNSSGLCHARHIQVRIEVRCVEQWNREVVKKYLVDYLQFNTGDKWDLEFVDHGFTPLNLEQPRLTDLEMQSIVQRRSPHLIIALFSGGLDSLAGLRWHLLHDVDAHFLLVSVNSSSTLLKQQSDLIKQLPANARKRVRHVPIALRLHQGEQNPKSDRERRHALTLRTRGLLFLSAGTLVSRLAAQQRFFVYENGLGAFNLSFNRAQLSGQANRAVNPRSLALFERFTTELFREKRSIENPFQFFTKAQVCKQLDHLDWVGLVSKTVTCGHLQRVPEQKPGEGMWHCGFCYSCWLRRQGLRAAGMSGEDTQFYYRDLARPESFKGKDFEKLNEWLDIQEQFRKLHRVLDIANDELAWRELTRISPELISTHKDMAAAQMSSEIEMRREVLKLYRTYVAEGSRLSQTSLRALLQLKVQNDASEMQAELFA